MSLTDNRSAAAPHLSAFVPRARASARAGVPLASLAVRGEAPVLPPRGQDRDSNLAQVLPPFGTNPPQRPAAGVPLMPEGRLISSDPRDLWYLALPQQIPPRNVAMILRSALGGDLWQAWQLMVLMLDTWPMFRKCAHELRQAVANVEYKVEPYTAASGKEPSREAQEKADLVRRAKDGYRPNQFSDEKSFPGMVYDITDSILIGMTMVELMWRRAGSRRSFEWLPRASAFVHPRHFTFTNGGVVTVFDDAYRRLVFAAELAGAPSADKFLCAQFMSRSGGALGNGLMRPLAWYWSAVVFNRGWMLNAAQKYGSPFTTVAYKPGLPQPELDRLESFVKDAGNLGYAMYPEGAEIKVHPAQSLGPGNAQEVLLRDANEACQLLLLGQTGTSSPTPGKLGNDSVHADVKREHVEGAAKWVGDVLTDQWARAVLRMNYGPDGDGECPRVEPNFTQAEPPGAAAERLSTVVRAGFPVLAEEAYRALGMRVPKQGDVVFAGGRLGSMADVGQEVGGQPQPQAGPWLGEPGEGGSDDGGGEPVEASRVEACRAVVRGASTSQLREFCAAYEAARASGRRNGEWSLVGDLAAKLTRRTQ